MSFLSHLERQNIKQANISKVKETVAYECHCIRQQNIKPSDVYLKNPEQAQFQAKQFTKRNYLG